MIKYINHFIFPKVWIFSGLLVLCVSVISQSAFAQSSRDVVNRLNRIENEINTLNRAVYKGEVSPNAPSVGGGAVQANTEVRMQQLERELRDVRGVLEEQSHMVRQMRTELDRSMSDMELRMSEIEGRGGLSASTSNAPAPYVSPQAQKIAPASGDYTWNGGSKQPSAVQNDASGTLGTLSSAGSDKAASLYENAFAKLKGGQYDMAEAEFQTFISQYPDHVLTSNAKYWLGETYYVRGQYERSARLFAEGYKKYPKGSKAPDNLLKLGMSLDGLGNKQDACVAFDQLQQEFSGKSQPVLRRAQQEMNRIGCS